MKHASWQQHLFWLCAWQTTRIVHVSCVSRACTANLSEDIKWIVFIQPKSPGLSDQFIRHLLSFLSENRHGDIVVGVTAGLITRLGGSDVRPEHSLCWLACIIDHTRTGIEIQSAIIRRSSSRSCVRLANYSSRERTVCRTPAVWSRQNHPGPPVLPWGFPEDKGQTLWEKSEGN